MKENWVKEGDDVFLGERLLASCKGQRSEDGPHRNTFNSFHPHALIPLYSDDAVSRKSKFTPDKFNAQPSILK